MNVSVLSLNFTPQRPPTSDGQITQLTTTVSPSKPLNNTFADNREPHFHLQTSQFSQNALPRCRPHHYHPRRRQACSGRSRRLRNLPSWMRCRRDRMLCSCWLHLGCYSWCHGACLHHRMQRRVRYVPGRMRRRSFGPNALGLEYLMLPLESLDRLQGHYDEHSISRALQTNNRKH